MWLNRKNKVTKIILFTKKVVIFSGVLFKINVYELYSWSE